jgi:antirestriction protein ArdC
VCKDHGTDERCVQCGRLLPVTFVVFAADQCDHDGWVAPVKVSNPDETIERCERYLTGSGARIGFGGDRAYYSPAGDAIQLPPFAAFTDAVAFYGTAFHELVHWTGHESRTGRLQAAPSAAFGSEGYAYEELVAELGATFICAEFGIEPTVREDHAQYLKGWLRALKDDSAAIWRAAQDASKAIAWIAANTSAGEPAAEEVVAA